MIILPIVFYSKSGSGVFTIDDRVKPDMVAPAVNVFGPTVGREAILQGGFTRKTGTSVSTALVAGCCAQMFQWGMVNGNDPYMNGISVKNYLIRGSKARKEYRLSKQTVGVWRGGCF